MQIIDWSIDCLTDYMHYSQNPEKNIAYDNV